VHHFLSRSGLILFLIGGSEAAFGQIALQRTTTGASGLVNPVSAAHAPGTPSTLYFVQQGGRIQSLDMLSPTATAQPFLSLDNTSFPGSNLSVVNETGLLGLAFHPNYQGNGLFYAFYTAENGTEYRVDQFATVGGVVQTGQRKNVITVSTPTVTPLKHAGGWIGFSPTAGTNLYVAVGDGPYVLTADGGDPENNAQDTSTLLGKMLRIDVGSSGLDFNDPASTYSIPPGNMTVNPNGNLSAPAPPSLAVRPEIYAYGLRNPWRASFDRQTGDLYIGDVGQRAREEINFIPAGRENASQLDQTPGSLNGINFGWRLREGSIATPGVGSEELRNDNVEPIFDYVRSGTSGELPFFGNSVTAGYVYRGDEFPDHGGDLNGTFLFADFGWGSRQIGSFRLDPVTLDVIDLRNRSAEVLASLPTGSSLPSISTFAEDGNGNLYAVDYFSGDVYKIVPVPEPNSLVCGGAITVAAWAIAGRTRRSRG
jgi:hypothetical protein